MSYCCQKSNIISLLLPKTCCHKKNKSKICWLSKKSINIRHLKGEEGGHSPTKKL